MNDKQIQLARQWGTLTDTAGEAIRWVEAVRQNSKRLNSEADDLIHRLRQTRNKGRNLQRAAETPMTIGFFGVSQAGKSFLISALGAGENGKFETRYGDQRVNFIDHVNPPGSGKEATGLVTRFTRQATPSPDPAFPVEVRLFREIDLAKILSNAWFNDFDQNKVEYTLDQDRIEKLLNRFASHAQTAPQPGVDADDVVSLWDYVKRSFEKRVSALEQGYWQRVLELAPYLAPDERAELFSPLWGELPELTEAYARIAASLRRLGNAETAFLPLAALASVDGNGQLQYSRDSIMCVDALVRQGRSQDQSLPVRPVIDGKPANAVDIRIPHLAALTIELVFPLIEPTREKSVETVDLLDFPGYRGRYKAVHLKDISADDNPVAQLLLRGKVAYLFENYTDSQAMNGLVLCTPEQSDVSDIAKVLERWVERTQGQTAHIRSQQACGLFWAITKFDIRIQNMLRLESMSQIEEGWFGLIQGAMEDRYGGLEFMKCWSETNGRQAAFNNTFLVRKPGIEGSFIAVRNQLEEIHADKQSRLTELGQAFVRHEAVQRRIENPQAAWDAVLTLDDGGMGYLAQAISGIANIDFKLNRLRQQLLEEVSTEQGIVARLTKYHQNINGDDVDRKKQLGTELASALYEQRKSIPELQHAMALDTEDLRTLYLSGLHQAEDTPDEAEDDTPPVKADLNPFASSTADNPFAALVSSVAQTAAPLVKTTRKTTEHRYAEAVFQRWIAHLRDLPERHRLLHALKIQREVAERLIDELITAANRSNLQERLETRLLSRQDSSSKREQLVMRQVLKAQTLLRDFIAWLDYLDRPMAERPVSIGNKQPLFTRTSLRDSEDLPLLPETPVDQATEYTLYWLTGLIDLVQHNAGHTAGSDITLEQNQQLGQILGQFEQVRLQ